ncbi:MAG TPA: hypothetical protein VGO86_14330, partial [Candidatus Dormibacteraeota bacterium]
MGAGDVSGGSAGDVSGNVGARLLGWACGTEPGMPPGVGDTGPFRMLDGTTVCCGCAVGGGAARARGAAG